jgi:hypothetical protein
MNSRDISIPVKEHGYGSDQGQVRHKLDAGTPDNSKEECNVVYEIKPHGTRKWWWPINSNSLVTKTCTVHKGHKGYDYKGHKYSCQGDSDYDE